MLLGPCFYFGCWVWFENVSTETVYVGGKIFPTLQHHPVERSEHNTSMTCMFRRYHLCCIQTWSGTFLAWLSPGAGRLSPDGWANVRPQRSQATFFLIRALLRWASARWRCRARWLASFSGHCGHCCSRSRDTGQRFAWASIRHL